MQFANFCEQCPDGHIDRKNFRLLMRSCHPGRNLERLEKRIFNMYDENRDGRISFAEFMVVMYVMSNGTPEENFRQIFRILDADGNGVITLRAGRGFNLNCFDPLTMLQNILSQQRCK